jgi:hypothetical protein
MKNYFLFVAVVLLSLFGASSTIAEVKRVEMRIGGYLCGN